MDIWSVGLRFAPSSQNVVSWNRDFKSEACMVREKSLTLSKRAARLPAPNGLTTSHETR